MAKASTLACGTRCHGRVSPGSAGAPTTRLASAADETRPWMGRTTPPRPEIEGGDLPWGGADGAGAGCASLLGPALRPRGGLPRGGGAGPGTAGGEAPGG